MTIAVLSDIHNNLAALKASTEHAKNLGATKFIFLGDYTTDCAYPQKTMDFLYDFKDSYDCEFIRGNREDYMLDYKNNPTGWTYGREGGSLLYNYENLRGKDFEFFESLPVSKIVQFNGAPEIMFCHGTPLKTNEAIFNIEYRMNLWDRACPSNYLIGGHTHLQREFVGKRTTILNTGAIGTHCHGTQKPCFITLKSHKNKWLYSFHEIEYNVNDTIAEIHESGLYKCGGAWSKAVIKSLETGENYPMKLAWNVMQAAKPKTYELGQAPSELWEKAAIELGL